MTRREFLFVSGSGAAAGLAGLPLSAGAAEGAGSNLFPKVPDVTKHVAEFATGTRYEDLPEGVLSLGKKSILDGFGLALASGRSKGSELLLAYIRTFGMNDAGATVLGTPYSLPVRFAALANGVAIHMEDFDDTQLAVAKDRVYGLLTHPTVTVLPAALGLAESGHRSGKELMLAYHVGVEVECKLAEASSPRSYGDGFHSTGVFGAFGSAVAAAKMKGLDLKRTMRAIAIAATHAGGLRENFGTLCKPLQAGQGAEAGVVAADLAAAGWDGAETILEASNGFFHAFAGSYDPQALVGKLGSPWTFSSPGISIKPHPSGSLTHPGMTEVLRLIRTASIRPEDVEKVDVGTNSKNVSTLIHHQPKTGLQAKFSMEYCIAVCLARGRAGLAEFTDETVGEPDVQAMLRRVRFYVDPEAEQAGFAKMTTLLSIQLKDGRTIRGRADFGKGSPSDPMSYDEVAEKFRGCAHFGGWPQAKADRLIELVAHLEDVDDVGQLTQLCRA